MEVAPTRRGKMDSTPGRSGDSHPRRLVEERREDYVLPCPALPQSLFAGQVARQAQEDALQTGHRLGQIVENGISLSIQTGGVAMPQQHLGSDYLQPTSFLSNSLQTSNNQVQFHSGGIISLHDSLCAGQARYTDLVFVKRCGQRWILEVTQQYLLELPGIDRVSVVRILFTFSETGSTTYDLQALFISVQSGQVHSLSDFLAVCDIISKEGGYKYCPGIDVKHYYDHYHSII